MSPLPGTAPSGSGAVAADDLTRALARASVAEEEAAVRLCRARQALRRRNARCCGTCAEYGCFEFECRAEPHAGAATR